MPKAKQLIKYAPKQIESKWPESDKATTGKQKVSKYNPQEIERRWQTKWGEQELYKFKIDDKKASSAQSFSEPRQKYYNLVELPYPSGDLHLGHWLAFVPPDVHARFKRMQGFNVFFPNGFDAFGLPAENAAIKRGLDPKEWTMANIATMHTQFDTMGTMIDWSHEAITCLPEYYRWNQWIFLKMLEKGLAYRGKALANWCPSCQTVLANENVEAGKCWRCGSEVVQKEIEQWFLKITAYADKLIWQEDPKVNWPKSVREGQNKWIGKKEGIEIKFQMLPISNLSAERHDTTSVKNEFITVFTTTPINYGATFLVIAPEHRFVQRIINKEIKVPDDLYKSIKMYINNVKKVSEFERLTDMSRDKTGVFTGLYVINHLTNEKIPVWISDFVLINYGTGAVQGCPAHDERDFDFAKKFGLPIKRVVTGSHGETGEVETVEQLTAGKSKGKMINSDFLNGMEFIPAMEKMMDYFEEKGWGKRVTTYHIHDWSISRQRYWGTPIPVVYCTLDGVVPIPEEQLPVTLPDKVDFTPKGEPPLATAKEWLNTTCPKCGGPAIRDAETMDTFFDSSWYFYRYLDPKDTKEPFSKDIARVLMPVDTYFGGAEHTLGHTLYARFFTKFFRDLGLISFDEFAMKRIQHGVILGPDGNRMSKSRGNIVNPDDLVLEFGTDTVRTYLCFMMPYEATAPWSPEGIWGSYRLLKRVWELQLRVKPYALSLKPYDLVKMHKTIKKVGEDIEHMKFNTAVAALMTWVNYLESKENISRIEYINLLLILAPFAPHMTEEVWQKIHYNANKIGEAFSSIHQEKWPTYNTAYLVEAHAEIIVQVNGKMREAIIIENSEILNQKIVEEKARNSGKIKIHLEGKIIKKVIYIPGKIINFVV